MAEAGSALPRSICGHGPAVFVGTGGWVGVLVGVCVTVAALVGVRVLVGVAAAPAVLVGTAVGVARKVVAPLMFEYGEVAPFRPSARTR